MCCYADTICTEMVLKKYASFENFKIPISYKLCLPYPELRAVDAGKLSSSYEHPACELLL